MEISKTDLILFGNICAENGARRALKAVGFDDEKISQIKAYKAYGTSIVKRWVETKQIEGYRKGTGRTSKIVYSKAELENLKKVDSRMEVKFNCKDF